MVITRATRDGLIAAVALAVFSALHVGLLKDALSKQERAASARLASSHVAGLTQAHLANDDLALYRVLGQLRQAPGVVEAYVVEPEVRPQGQAGTFVYPLKNDGRSWGNLVLVYSTRLVRHLIGRQWGLGAFASFVLWGLFFWRAQLGEKIRMRLQAQVLELEAALGAETRRRKSAEDREKIAALQTGAALRQAVAQIPRPVIVLDIQQRLVAISPAAQKALEIKSLDSVLQKSWHEIPPLSLCGKALELSLAAPGESVNCSEPESPYRYGIKSHAQSLGGTWIDVSVE